MTPERWAEIKTVFAEAVACPAELRRAFLSNRCGADVELHDAVRRLLDAHAAAPEFMEASPVEGLAARAAAGGRFSGSVRGPYRLGRLLGAGGMGEVYEARDGRTGNRVAVKVLIEGGAERARRLAREAQLAGALDHPNICRVYETGEDEAGPYVAMELLEGRVLADVVSEGGVDTTSVVSIALQVAEAIAHAHARGIVHRDLKTANVIVTRDGPVKVLDFGLARRLPQGVEREVSAASLTEAGTIAGTLSCLAPEVLRGARADARSDVWAFGIVLHELVTGRLPFEGRTPFELTSAVLYEPPQPLPRQTPAGLQAIRDNCLAKDPAMRYQTGEEILADLRAFQAGARIVRRNRRRRPVRAALVPALALVAVLTVTIGTILVNRHTANGATPAIAVLPLASQPGQDHLASGVTEALIDRLGTIDTLRVISRASATRYRIDAPLADLRRDLHAGTVIRGSVERGDGRVRLTVDVVETATGRLLSHQTYDRPEQEVLALENDAVRAIVERLGVPMSDAQRATLAAARAVDPSVYEAFLKGRFYWNRRTTGSLDQAVTFFRTAIDRDPTYAPAHAALADCYNQLATVLVGAASPAALRPRAKAEAIRAIQIDDSLAEAHATLAYVSHYDWDWATAQREFRRALELNPNLALAHVWYANYLMSRLRMPEALAEVRRAEQLDPFSLVVVTNVGWVLAYAKRPDEAIAAYRRAIALDESYVQARGRLADQLADAGRFDEAIAERQKVIALTRRSPSSVAGLAGTYAEAGRRAEATALLREVVRRSQEEYVSPIAISGVYLRLADTDAAFEWLEQAFRERSNGMVYLALDSAYDRVRNDSRYRQLLTRVGLPDVR